ncbi:MAG: BREX system ATP-binding protein BrxD [Nannocystaceae bacterium]
MSSLPARDIEHIFEKLRGGVVPERGLEVYAVGIDAQLGELRRQLSFVANGDGAVKFLRGGYGCGKTFTARLAVLEAQRQGFATSFVVVSDNDLKFHRFDEVYAKVVSELGTASCPRGALGDILDRFIGKIEDALIAGGADEDADDFDAKVSARLEQELAALTGGKAPADFVRVIQTIFALKQQGNLVDAGALMSWISGSTNVAAAAKKLAGIKGDISSTDAMGYLRGIVEIVHAAGYRGLMIVIDEAETILRSRSDSRGKSLNGLRQIYDVSGDYPRLLWLVTGTPEFFDSRQGVAGLAPLHDRIKFDTHGKYANLRQPQLQLSPFDRPRLVAVATRLRDEYPSQHPQRHRTKISDAFIEHLVDEVTTGFRGQVGLVPRQFLRELVGRMDLVDQFPDYEPMGEGYQPPELSDEEKAAIAGVDSWGEGDELVAEEDVW